MCLFDSDAFATWLFPGLFVCEWSVDDDGGIGIRRTWRRLLDGQCGIVSVRERGPLYEKLPCQVAALVPEGEEKDGGWMAREWLSRDVCCWTCSLK